MILAVAAAAYGTEVILLTLGGQTIVVFLLLIVSMAGPIDFTKWTAFCLLLFLLIFTFSIGTIISVFVFKIPIMKIISSMVAVTVLSLAMLLNLQVLFNGAIFELYPYDFVLGSILMFADIM